MSRFTTARSCNGQESFQYRIHSSAFLEETRHKLSIHACSRQGQTTLEDTTGAKNNAGTIIQERKHGLAVRTRVLGTFTDDTLAGCKRHPAYY
ncbi:hypothetical protein PHMEG_0002277 [Phytophthora megakarya]|uniref:Uncharacterized protein n=1 Tax=Phytophthora megakarya TaxID=4795 RepID=A0A225X0S8_9STRA|nr:hypothetical protein PHMEG_0002277 [Phytophthora megakarya]